MTTCLQKILIRVKADIFIETMEVWKQWDDILSTGETTKNCQQT